jgi:uncharacterized membrane protein YbhN (UPF0104 family)
VTKGGRIALRLPKIAGGVVAIVCVAFFLKTLLGAVGGIDLERPAAWVFVVAALLATCYGICLYLLALSWISLLRPQHPGETNHARLARVYALTQFAKYLPGNVFHLAGRHAILRRQGWPHRALVVSTLHENVVLVLSAVVIGLTLAALFPASPATDWLLEAGTPPTLLSAAARISGGLVLAVLVTAAAVVAFRRIGRTDIRRALCFDCLFFAIQGVLFVILLYAVSAELRPEALGLVALSWIAGFLIPGAPGGVGVREVTMMVLLGGAAGQHDIVLTTALYRIVTFGGDLLFFGFGALRAGTGDCSEHRGSTGEAMPSGAPCAAESLTAPSPVSASG